ncbi:hypothetical protein SK128_001752 [Halocaridina rubra]|uniref:Uncharacterized protein n=1 Tax=Halocaridina rubra TaxID=373956 RepID=A0AAN8XKQ0_HALRR
MNCFSSENALPDLILSSPPTPLSSTTDALAPFAHPTYYPLTPSPTPTSPGGCLRCRNSTGRVGHMAFSRPDPADSSNKVQLKLDHIQTVRQRLHEEPEEWLVDQNFCQRQKTLPQLTWDLPPPRHQQKANPAQQNISPSERNPKGLVSVRGCSVEEAGTSSEGPGRNILAFRQIGVGLRLVADQFHLQYSVVNIDGSLILV